MSRTYSKPANKHQKQPEVHFKEYLYSTYMPLRYTKRHLTTEIEFELLEDITSMRKRFRRLSHKMRNDYL